MTDIKKMRVDAGFTQVDVATELGVTLATVSRWENGHSVPHKAFQKMMKRMFKV